MKSRLSLKNLARAALNNLFVLLLICSGCSSSTKPTYLKENTVRAVEDICKNEYSIDVKVKRVGSTLWIYLPVKDIFVESQKPEKYIERFKIEQNKDKFEAGVLKLEYLINVIAENEKEQLYKFDKKIAKQINDVWSALRRVLFSMDRSKENQPRFFCFVITDINKGFEIRQIFYNLDMKKISYGLISWGEYQHRTIQDIELIIEAIGDKEGRYLAYKDITMDDFISGQIQHRIKLKFQKPEVDSNADIDKEIMKIAVRVIKTYAFNDFRGLELVNLLTKNKTVLSQAAVLARPIE